VSQLSTRVVPEVGAVVDAVDAMTDVTTIDLITGVGLRLEVVPPGQEPDIGSELKISPPAFHGKT